MGGGTGTGYEPEIKYGEVLRAVLERGFSVATNPIIDIEEIRRYIASKRDEMFSGSDMSLSQIRDHLCRGVEENYLEVFTGFYGKSNMSEVIMFYRVRSDMDERMKSNLVNLIRDENNSIDPKNLSASGTDDPLKRVLMEHVNREIQSVKYRS